MIKNSYKEEFISLNDEKKEIRLDNFKNTPITTRDIDKKNYRNLILKKVTLGSKNVLYVNEFINHHLLHKFKLVEIHNRPSYVNQIIRKKITSYNYYL